MAGAISLTASPSPLSSLLLAYPDRATAAGAAGILDRLRRHGVVRLGFSTSGLTLTLTITVDLPSRSISLHN
jgi:hypothetical protein